MRASLAVSASVHVARIAHSEGRLRGTDRFVQHTQNPGISITPVGREWVERHAKVEEEPSMGFGAE